MSTLLPTWATERLDSIPGRLGTLLYGSRAVGQAREDSDIDLLIIVAGGLAGETGGNPGRPPEVWTGPGGVQADVHFMTVAQWLALPTREHWQNFGLSRGRPMFDPTGVVARGLAAFQTPPPGHRAQAPEQLDSYLNSAYRSVKAWRAGDELGARLHAALSLTFLLDGLFRLSGHWTPYWDRLEGQWPCLIPLGLDVEALATQVAEVARHPTDHAQLTLYAQIESWMRTHGHAEVLDAWNPDFHTVMNRT